MVERAAPAIKAARQGAMDRRRLLGEDAQSFRGFEHLPNINFSGAPAQSALLSGAAPLAEEFYSDFATGRELQTSEFADATVTLSRRWSIEAGIEHFHSTQSDSTNWAGYFFQPKTPAYYSASSDRTNFKAGLNYKPGEHALIYFAFAQGFREGGFNYIAANSHPTIPHHFNPDTLDNFELGWKSQYLEGHLRWDSALYYMAWKDYQVGVSVRDHPTALTRISATRASTASSQRWNGRDLVDYVWH